MKTPLNGDKKNLKRLGRFLKGMPRVVMTAGALGRGSEVWLLLWAR